MKQLTKHTPEGNTNMTDLIPHYAEFVENMMLTEGDTRIIENTLGLVGESGEIAEKIKKYFRDGHIDKANLQKELGDVIFYWFAIHGAMGIDPAQTIEVNIEKLSDRKLRGVLRGSGDNR